MSLLGATQNRETWNFTTELGTRFWGRDGEVRGSRHLSEQCGYHEGCGWLDGGMSTKSTNITSPGWGRKKYLKPAWQKERLVITCEDVCCMRVMEPQKKSLLSFFFLFLSNRAAAFIAGHPDDAYLDTWKSGSSRIGWTMKKGLDES